MDIRAVKGRALTALTIALGLLIAVIFLISAGKVPVLLIVIMVLFAGYSFKLFWSLRAPRV